MVVALPFIAAFSMPLIAAISGGPSNLSNLTFEAIFRNGLMVSKDKFAELPPVPALKGGVIFIPFTDGNNSYPTVDTHAFFTYSDGELVLNFSSENKSNVLEMPRGKLTYHQELVVYSRLTPGGSFVGTNALAVRSRVQRYDLRTITIAFGESAQPVVYRSKMRFRLNGAEARRLSQVAAVEVRIKDPAAFSNGAKCSHLLHSATLRHPEEVDDLNCTVKAQVESWRIIRRDTGEVLRGEPDNS